MYLNTPFLPILMPRNTAEYDAFHVKAGCPDLTPMTKTATQRPVSSMSPIERKGEYYGLLSEVACPGVVDAITDIRKQFPLGLVECEGDGNGLDLRSSVDAEFLDSVDTLAKADDYLPLLDLMYRKMRGTLDAAGTVWATQMEAEGNTDYARLQELIEPIMHQKYGSRAVAKRTASATAQTASIGLGFLPLMQQLYRRDKDRDPTRPEVVAGHKKSVVTAVEWSDFQRMTLVALEAKLRQLRDDHNGIEPIKEVSAFELGKFGEVVFRAQTLEELNLGAIDTSEGRFGCPGKRFIPTLWQWTNDVAKEYAMQRFALPTVETSGMKDSEAPLAISA